MNSDKPDDEAPASESLRMGHSRTPQEKKRLSYAKNHRSSFGERGSCIPKRKRSYARIARRSQNRPLDTLKSEPVDEFLTLMEFRLRVAKRKKRSWGKVPDISLGQHVANHKRYRAEMEAAGGRRAAKRKSTA